MADTKISALTAAASALGADEFAVNEAGTSKKVTLTQVATFIGAASVGGSGVKTTPLALSSGGSAATAMRSDASAQSPGGIASITANQSTGLSTTEKQIVSATIPANFMAVGTTFRLTVYGKVTVGAGGGTLTFRVRIGTTTLTGNIATSVAPTIFGTGEFTLQATCTVRTTGASGTITGYMLVTGTTSSAPFSGQIFLSTEDGATVVVDTTAQKILEATMQLGSNTNTAIAYVAGVEVVQM